MRSRPAWRGWSARSQVERVDLYTRQSLYVLLWGTPFVFLLPTVGDVVDAPGAGTGLVVGAVVVTGAASPVLRDVVDLYPELEPLPWRTLTPFLVVAGLGLVFFLGLPGDLRLPGALVIWSALAWALGGLRQRRVTLALMVALVGVPLVGEVAWETAVFGLLAGGFFVFTVRASLWLYGVVVELDRARGAQAALAVAEERLRFSRDVHDVLGRRLSTIAVQAELAATLAARGESRAADQMLEVRGVAHEAMREARELARGYRASDLAQELEGARSLLRSAGISVTHHVGGLPEAWHEAAAWVVRESVTNVLRHSAATQVSIGYADPVLSVVNDGAAPVDPGSGGSGLDGLRERLAPLGAFLAVTRSGSSFEVSVTLPGRAPGPGPGAGPGPGTGREDGS